MVFKAGIVTVVASKLFCKGVRRMLNLALIGPIGWPELIIILFVVLLLFGPKRLPDMAKALGESVRELRKSAEGKTEEPKKESEEKKEE